MHQSSSQAPAPGSWPQKGIAPKPAQTYDGKEEPQKSVAVDIFMEMGVHW